MCVCAHMWCVRVRVWCLCMCVSVGGSLEYLSTSVPLRSVVPCSTGAEDSSCGGWQV